MIKILLFSILRERIGRATLDVRHEPGMTAGGLLDRLTEAYPVVASFRPVIRVAVNETYAGESALLQGGDEVALITPVSGG